MMKRRTFLQRFGSILAAVGIAEAEWLSWGNPYYQALAQPTSRKLALLVGINQYPNIPPLGGCLTDLELQKELLIHRFGFQPSDILCLSDEEATRDGIETAFIEHLIDQSKAGDAVVFHFSGYGSRVKQGALIGTTENALVPVDYSSQDGETVDYLLVDTLFLLLRSLPTESAIAVLDTSFYAQQATLPNGLLIRATETSPQAALAESEVDFQKQLRNRIVTKDSLALVAASTPKQSAREILCSGFSAGLFTYALTQYLWETVEPKAIQFSLSHLGSTIERIGSRQQPAILDGQKSQFKERIRDNLLATTSTGAEGAITSVEEEGKNCEIFLAGIPPQVLECYENHSRFKVISDEETDLELVLRSRSGLRGKAQIASMDNRQINPSLEVGQLIQESVRIVSRNIDLTIALDNSLERIERVDATSAFSAFEDVSTVIAKEQPADYVFGKLPAAYSRDSSGVSSMTSPSRYGFFSLGGKQIPNTIGEEGEVVKLAVQRLAPKLKNLLAAKLWRLTDNEASSCLQVKASMEINNGISPRMVMQQKTGRNLEPQKNLSNQSGNRASSEGIPTVPIGSRMQYRVQNQGEIPLYLILLGLDTSKNAVALYPWDEIEEDDASQTKPVLRDIKVEPGETRVIPQSTAGFEWVAKGLVSWCETQLVFSTSPFSKSLKALENSKHSGAKQERVLALLNPLEVAEAMLLDLHNASNEGVEPSSSNVDSYILNVNNWAGLSFVYQVV